MPCYAFETLGIILVSIPIIGSISAIELKGTLVVISDILIGVVALIFLILLGLLYIRLMVPDDKREAWQIFLGGLKKSLLYIFLPCAIVTAGMIIWAIATHQLAFR